MPDFFHPDRLQKLADLQKSGADGYPEAITVFADKPRNMSRDLLEVADDIQNTEACVAGRVLGRRGYGKLAFIDLHDGDGSIQVVLQKDLLAADEFALLKHLNLGDFIAVRGEFKKTDKGQDSVYGSHFQILTKGLENPPTQHFGLADSELRARRRYVDLFTNQEVRENFKKRASMIQAMREVFLNHDFLEVETPVMHPIYGGANAEPFTTTHNALDMKLYMRIAPELYLKRLLVGGIERVFEFARVFRNEGLSPRHNPEFTMAEFYQAYTDYRGMMDLTEELVLAAANASGCGKSVTFRGQDYSLTAPFARIRYADAFEQHLGFAATDREAINNKLAEIEHEVPEGDGYAWWKAVNTLFEEFVEDKLHGPIFVYDYPAAICPLAKPLADDPTWAGRFEFFLGGMDLANAFSELNDPQLQLQKFEEQVADADPESPNEIDLDYVRALAYGLPPAGGCGIGVDRLMMVLLGQDTIRDVLLFPQLRPEEGLQALVED
ncbi:MAG: lysine--tRNA ligase [Planctomycetota bacterium]|nr:lysine--tRNA ligase [Planctomycetota bacterium]